MKLCFVNFIVANIFEKNRFWELLQYLSKRVYHHVFNHQEKTGLCKSIATKKTNDESHEKIKEILEIVKNTDKKLG